RVDFRRADPLLFRPSRAISKEHSMRSSGVRVLAAVVFTLATAAAAHAQGSFFTSLSGTVVDSSGGVIPGADVKGKNNGTGAEFNTVSGSDGGFTIPSLPGGTYSGHRLVDGVQDRDAQRGHVERGDSGECEGDAVGRHPRRERHRDW